MKRQGKARHNLSGLRPRRKLRFETLESRELFYAPPMPSIDLPPPPSLSPPVLEKLNRPHHDLSLLPQGSPFNSTRYTPNPIGLYPNGSTQVISPKLFSTGCRTTAAKQIRACQIDHPSNRSRAWGSDRYSGWDGSENQGAHNNEGELGGGLWRSNPLSATH